MKVSIAIAALTVLAMVAGTPALAADMAVKAPAAPAASAWNWTGLYVGADVGHMSNNVGMLITLAPAAGTATANPTSASVGGNLGYLYQYKHLVVGVEGDLSWLHGNGNGPFPGLPINGIIATTSWDSSVRGVAGVAVDRGLLYATGGWSWLDGGMCVVGVFPVGGCVPTTAGPSVVSGWIAGGGFAYAFTDNLIGRIEYLHADYGPFNYTGTGGGGGPVPVHVTDTADTVRLGLSWKFRVP